MDAEVSAPRLTLALLFLLMWRERTEDLRPNVHRDVLIGGRRSMRGGRVSARRNTEVLSSGVIRQRRDDGSKAVIPSPRGRKRSNPSA